MNSIALSPETNSLLPSALKKSKTPAERQREYRLRQKHKILNDVEQEKRRENLKRKNQNQKKIRDQKRIIKKNKNIDKPAKKSRANYQREYRLKKKNNVDLNSDLAEVIPRQEAGSSWYLAPSTTAQSTQLSHDAGPIIIQHEVIIETERLPTMKRKKSTLEQLENVHNFPKLKRIQHTSRDNNFELELTPRLLNNEIEKTQNQPDEKVEIFEPMQPQDFSDDDDCEYLESAFERKYIRNEDGIIADEESIPGNDSNHLYFGYRSHQPAHKLCRKNFMENSFGHVCNIYDRLWFLQDLKSGSTDEENLLKQITEETMTEGWSVGDLELFACDVLSREHTVIRRVLQLSDGSKTEHGPRSLQIFHRLLFQHIRNRVKDCVSMHKDPRDALVFATPSISKIAHRYRLVKLAVQVEVCDTYGVVCSWAVSELVSKLAMVAEDQCIRRKLAPRALSAQHLVPALEALHRKGATPRCTRARIVATWQSLCRLRSAQLSRLARAGDRLKLVPEPEQLKPRDWPLVNLLLLRDDDEQMNIVTPMSLLNVESYVALAALVLVMISVPGDFRRPTHPSSTQWALVYARYARTGRTASIILLQRRWYHLRRMAQAAIENNAPPHPLLDLIAIEFKHLMTEQKYSWAEIVRLGYYVPLAAKILTKQTNRKRWYLDIKRLESMLTVDEINEFLKKKVQQIKETSKCGLAQNTIPINSVAIAVGDDSNEGNDVTLNANNRIKATEHDNERNQTDKSSTDMVSLNNASQIETLEVLQRIDPNAAQVTVIVENDSDEDAPVLFNNKVNMEEQDVSRSSETSTYSNKETAVDVNESGVTEDKKIDTIENKESKEDINVLGIKDESKELKTFKNKKFRTEEQTHSSQEMLGEHAILEAIRRIKKETYSNEMEVYEEGKSNENICDVNERKIKREDDFDENTTIDMKLLYTTQVELTRIDETPAWNKHASNNTIDVRRAGLLKSYGDSNELLLPIKANYVSDDSTSGDDCNDDSNDDSYVVSNDDSSDDSSSEDDSIISNDRNDLKPELRGVSKRVLRNSRNQRLLKLCKPAVLRLRKLKESEIPRTGRVVKRVELADIEEVRRINKNILTAQVKPIPLCEKKEDLKSEQEQEEESSEKLQYIARELQLFERDMRSLFKLPDEEKEALIRKAESIYLNPVTNTRERFVFLNHDNDDLDSAVDMNRNEDNNSTIDMNRDKKENAGTVKEVKKKKKKRKRRKEESVSPPPLIDAYQEWERQKHIVNKYFEIGNMGNKSRGQKRKIDDIETTSDAGVEKRVASEKTNDTGFDVNEEVYREPAPILPVIEVVKEINGNIQNINNGYLSKLLNLPPKEPNVDTLRNSDTGFDVNEEEVYREPAPILPVIEVVKEINGNIQNISNGYLSKLLNLPPKEPNVDTLRYMLLSPMEMSKNYRRNETMKTADDVIKENNKEMEVMPTITAVCSLADTETIDDDADEEKVEVKAEESPRPSTSRVIQVKPETSHTDPTMTITPMKTNVVIRVGDQLVSKSLEIPEHHRMAEEIEPQAMVMMKKDEPKSTNHRLQERCQMRSPPPLSPLRMTMYRPLDDGNIRPLSAQEWMKLNKRVISREKWEQTSKQSIAHTQPDTHTQSDVTIVVDEDSGSDDRGAPIDASEPQSGNSDPSMTSSAAIEDADSQATPSSSSEKKKRYTKATGFKLFADDLRKALVASNPKLSFGRISKLISNDWHSVSKADKQSWHERAVRYNEETARLAKMELESSMGRVKQRRLRSSVGTSESGGSGEISGSRGSGVISGSRGSGEMADSGGSGGMSDSGGSGGISGSGGSGGIVPNLHRMRQADNLIVEKRIERSKSVPESSRKQTPEADSTNPRSRVMSSEDEHKGLEQQDTDVNVIEERINKNVFKIVKLRKDSQIRKYSKNIKSPPTITPEYYVRFDRRKELTVLKLNMFRTHKSITPKYCIVTEKNIPCSHPGYWTVDRDPPGLSQFLIWPNDSSKDKTDGLESEYSNSDSLKHVIVIDEDDLESVDKLIINKCEKSQTRANENKNLDEFLVNERKKDDGIDKNVDSGDNKNDSEVKGDNADVSNNINKCPRNQLFDDDDSDSDSEGNKLQIVESENESAEELPDTNVSSEMNIDNQNDNFGNKNAQDRKELEKDEDNVNNKVGENNSTDNTNTKSDTDSANKAKSMIKVKSFASVGRMEAKTVAVHKPNPDIIEKNNRYYKKLLDVPVSPGSNICIPTYALMLSEVNDIKECDRLLRAGDRLQVFDWSRGQLEPLIAVGGASDPIRLGHSDPVFLSELLDKLQACCEDPYMYAGLMD